MQEIKILGQMDNSDGTFESANRVYSIDGISPTVPTCGGGGIQPKVMEIVAIDEQNKSVRTDTFGTLTTDGSSPKHNNRVCEIVAMRGRDPENPSDRTTGNKNLVQRLEPNSEGIANTITTVQKDNLVLVKQATKDGYTQCQVGGVRFELSEQYNTQRKSARERTDMSYSDNGEYP